jgi:hypothetical protein
VIYGNGPGDIKLVYGAVKDSAMKVGWKDRFAEDGEKRVSRTPKSFIGDQLKTMAKKYTGWAMAVEQYGVMSIVVVSAKSRKGAVTKFAALGHYVLDDSQIRHVCLVKFPGPKEVQQMKPKNWNKAFKPI